MMMMMMMLQQGNRKGLACPLFQCKSTSKDTGWWFEILAGERDTIPTHATKKNPQLPKTTDKHHRKRIANTNHPSKSTNCFRSWHQGINLCIRRLWKTTLRQHILFLRQLFRDHLISKHLATGDNSQKIMRFENVFLFIFFYNTYTGKHVYANVWALG